MLWLLRIAIPAPEARRLRPFGVGFAAGHTRVFVVLAVILVVVVILVITRRRGR